MKEEGFRLTVIFCWSHLSIAMAGFAFVDDTDIINTTNTAETTGEELFDQHKKVIDTWEGALRATGIALKERQIFLVSNRLYIFLSYMGIQDKRTVKRGRLSLSR